MSKYPPITHAFLFLTNQCCCACPYCFENRTTERMSYETAFKAMNMLKSNAEQAGLTPGITYFGGEPMLEYDTIIVPLTNFIRNEYNKPFSLHMITNGVLLDSEKIKFFVDNHIDIQLSIDGGKDTQDKNRPLKNGDSSYDRLEKIIPELLTYAPRTPFRATIIPNRVRYFYQDMIDIENLGFNCGFMMPNVFEPWSEEDKNEFVRQLRKYSDHLISIFRCNKKPIAIRNYDDSMRMIPRINKAIEDDIIRPENLCGLKVKCGMCTSNNGSIACNGDIYSCVEEIGNDLFKMGTIEDGIIENKRARLQSFYKNDSITLEKCKDCKLNRICDYGCISKNYTINHDFNNKVDLFCWWDQLFLDEAIYICNAFGEDVPESFINYWEGINNGK